MKRKVRKKTKENVFVGMMVAGLLFCFGTTGSAEIDAIGIGQMLIQYIIGGAVIAVGFIGLKVIGSNILM